MFGLAQCQYEQHQLRCHDDRKALREVPVPRMRAVERPLTGQYVEAQEVVGYEEPGAVEDAIDRARTGQQWNAEKTSKHLWQTCKDLKRNNATA